VNLLPMCVSTTPSNAGLITQSKLKVMSYTF
jgi:hypothetical protein